MTPTFGQRLTELRLQRQLTIPDAARLVGTEPRVWRGWEGDENKPKLHTLARLDEVLGLTSDEFYLLSTGKGVDVDSA